MVPPTELPAPVALAFKVPLRVSVPMSWMLISPPSALPPAVTSIAAPSTVRFVVVAA